jgi:2-dehydrotetronate isomerase
MQRTGKFKRMRLSANIGFLFADRPLIERIHAAAACGFAAIEMHWPYDVPPEPVRQAIAAHRLAMLGVNTPRGGSADFGLGAVPGREAEFQSGFDLALDYARTIGAAAIHCMAGKGDPADRAAAESVFVDNLRIAADKAQGTGITLLIEPINHRDAPGYVLSHSAQAAAIIERIGRLNIKLMFDCYHLQITEGDLTRRLEALLPIIGHVQIAAVPSRAEPDEGEIDYAHILKHLDRLGYDGWVGAEYKPRGLTEAGLGWRERLAVANSE